MLKVVVTDSWVTAFIQETRSSRSASDDGMKGTVFIILPVAPLHALQQVDKCSLREKLMKMIADDWTDKLTIVANGMPIWSIVMDRHMEGNNNNLSD